MNDFDERWRRCAEEAAKAARPNEAAPFGFAARVVAMRGAVAAAEPDLWEVCGRLALQLTALAAAVLLACAAWELPHWADHRPLAPGIEGAVGDILWRL